MCMYFHIYIYMYTYAYSCIHTYTYAYIHKYIHTYIYIYTCTNICKYAHVYMYIYIYIYMCTHKHTYTCINTYIFTYIYIGLVGRVFARGSGVWDLISGHVILKNQKMVLDASLLNTQHYKVWIKGKIEQSRKRSCTLPYTLV